MSKMSGLYLEKSLSRKYLTLIASHRLREKKYNKGNRLKNQRFPCDLNFHHFFLRRSFN